MSGYLEQLAIRLAVGTAELPEELRTRHAQWVLDALRTCRTQVRMRPPLVSGAQLPLLDERLRLRVDMAAQLSLFAEPPQVEHSAGCVWRNGKVVEVRVRSLERSAVRGIRSTSSTRRIVGQRWMERVGWSRLQPCTPKS